MPEGGLVQAFRKFSARLDGVPALEKAWRKLLMGTLPRLPGVEQAPVIRHRRNRWIME
jgi:hypothetical protein